MESLLRLTVVRHPTVSVNLGNMGDLVMLWQHRLTRVEGLWGGVVDRKASGLVG